MHLKALEINGYKSFAKKGHFDFSSTISAIVGPNGSGKSNVAEAFRFVLGEQSFKSMRSKKGSDLLFAGQNGQVNRAWVSITLDNGDKSLDIDYTEVVITRTVLRDGSNEYQINGNTVRAKDVVELLAGANIGSSGHHIISQGEADKILTISPRDRKLLIEEALGLKVYTIKKQEAERKLAKTKENLQEVKNQERANTPRLNELKRKVEKIQEARELRSKLSSLYARYLPGKFIFNEKLRLAQLQEQEIHARAEEITSQLQVVDKQASHTDTQDAHTNIDQEKRLLEEQLRELRIRKGKYEKTIAQLEARIEFAQQQEEQVQEIAREGAGRRESVARKLHEIVRSLITNRLTQLDITEEVRAGWEAQLGEYDMLDPRIQDEYHMYAQSLLEDTLQAQNTSNQENHGDFIAQYQSDIKQAQTAQEELVAEEGKLLAQMDDIRAKQMNPNQAKQELQIKRLELEQAQSNINHEAQEVAHAITNLQNKLQEFEVEERHARELLGREVDEILTQSSQTDSSNVQLREEIIQARTLLAHAGVVGGEEVIEEYTNKKKEAEYIADQLTDLEASTHRLQELIAELDTKLEEKFRAGLGQINQSFNSFFQTLFSGGTAELREVQVPVRSEEEEYELGIEMLVSLPNKKVSSLDILSGGERSLTSIALLFAMSQVAPPPFIILDETDAALDEANSKRYGDMIEELAKHSQLVLITHNRETMSRAGVLYGVTMGDDGVSRLLSVSLEEASAVAK